MPRFTPRLLILSAALLMAAGPVAAATGEPLPGIDVLVRKKPGPKPTTLYFGQPDLPAIPADFFGPGSEPFPGPIPLQGPCPDSAPTCSDSRLDYVEGATPDVVDVEMVSMTLTSIDPIQVNVGGVDSFFDVVVDVSGEGLPPGAPVGGQLEIPVGETLTPGTTHFVVDSFFDITYRVQFFEAGTGNPAGPGLEHTARLYLQDVDVPVTRLADGVQPVVLGFDGVATQAVRYLSEGGGCELSIESLLENPVAAETASWGEVKGLYD